MMTNMIIGMPHLLSNYELNLNHIAKLFGDNHWRYMSDAPSTSTINGKRVYQSFLKLDFDINSTFKEDDIFQVGVSGDYIDDYIFKTVHVFGNNTVKMYTIGITVNDGKILKAITYGKKLKDFWSAYKKNKKKKYFKNDPLHFPTYYNIDFNCANILYCANYLKFGYQYCYVKKLPTKFKSIDFFSNIEPDKIITVDRNDNDLVLISENSVIARINL